MGKTQHRGGRREANKKRDRSEKAEMANMNVQERASSNDHDIRQVEDAIDTPDAETSSLETCTQGLALSSQPQPIDPPSRPLNQYVTIRLTPTHGLGIFALRPLPAGTRLLSERPIVSILSSAHCKDIDIQRPFSRCDPDAQSACYALADARDRSMSRVASIFQTNCLRQGDGACICLDVCRINHSCVPNAHFAWDERRYEMTVHAVRGIGVGEEVLTTYVKPFQTKRARERQLEHYKFKCGCEACVQRGERWRGSDKRRMEMWRLFHSVKDFASHQCSPEGMLVKAERLIELLDEERLLGAYVGTVCGIAAHWARKQGDLKGALGCAKKQMQNDEICVGLDHSAAEASIELVEELEEEMRSSKARS